MAFIAEGRGWRLSGDVCFKVKLWGLAVHCDPQGVLSVEFDDGESFSWTNVSESAREGGVGGKEGGEE